jgi:hypothetical protein
VKCDPWIGLETSESRSYQALVRIGLDVVESQRLSGEGILEHLSRPRKNVDLGPLTRRKRSSKHSGCFTFTNLLGFRPVYALLAFVIR